MDKKRMDELRKKRSQLALAREHEQSRNTYGKELVSIVAASTGRQMSLDDFETSRKPSLLMDWPPDIRDAPGLVAAYIHRDEAEKLLVCIRTLLGALSGTLGFHDAPYLGLAVLHDIDPTHLLTIAEAANESVVFNNDAPFGLLMVDCYRSPPGEPFSIVVQGDELVRSLAECFPAKR